MLIGNAMLKPNRPDGQQQGYRAHIHVGLGHPGDYHVKLLRLDPPAHRSQRLEVITQMRQVGCGKNGCVIAQLAHFRN